jgi:hypothetical protein
MQKKVLITGIGGVGGYAGHLLARVPGVELFLADVRERYAREKANNIHIDNFFQANSVQYPKVSGIKIDMFDVPAMTQILKEIKPDVILNLASLQSWWVVHHVPPDVRIRISDGYPVGTGLRPWAPNHMAFLYNLMVAINDAKIKTHVVNGAGCDYCHEGLDKIGLAPTVGLGDFAFFEPMVKRIVGDKLNIPASNVDVTMVGHHVMCIPIQERGTSQEIPHWINLRVMGKDVTDQFDIEKDIWAEIPKKVAPPEPLHGVNQEYVASSAVKNVLAILFDTGEIVHAPGPCGLPGGYPTRLSANGAEVVVPEGLTKEKMIELMKAANKCEGIETVTDDGALVATEHTTKIVEEVFEIDWKYKEMRPQDALKASEEIRNAYKKLTEKYKDYEAKLAD